MPRTPRPEQEEQNRTWDRPSARLSGARRCIDSYAHVRRPEVIENKESMVGGEGGIRS